TAPPTAPSTMAAAVVPAVTSPAPAPAPSGAFAVSTPLALDHTSVTPGMTLHATVTYRNGTSAPVTIQRLVIAGRPPGGTHAGGPYDDLAPQLGATTVQPGATVTLAASRTFSALDTKGTWESYSTFEDTSGHWHDGGSVFFSLGAAPAPAPAPTPTPT